MIDVSNIDLMHLNKSGSKINEKLIEGYLNLVKEKDYKYIICVDASDFHKGPLSKEDLKTTCIGVEKYKTGYFLIDIRYNYVDGILFIDNSGEYCYLKNPNSKHTINLKNSALLSKHFTLLN